MSFGNGNYAPSPFESRADHTDRLQPSQDCVLIHHLIDLPRSFLDFGRRAGACRRGAAAGPRSAQSCSDRRIEVFWDR